MINQQTLVAHLETHPQREDRCEAPIGGVEIGPHTCAHFQDGGRLVDK